MLHDDQRTSAPSSTNVSIKHAGLHGHVNAAGDPRSLSGVSSRRIPREAPSTGHFDFGDVQFFAPPLGERDVFDDVVGEFGHVGSGAKGPAPAVSGARGGSSKE